MGLSDLPTISTALKSGLPDLPTISTALKSDSPDLTTISTALKSDLPDVPTITTISNYHFQYRSVGQSTGVSIWAKWLKW